MLLRYLNTISKLCASISNFVFFDIGVSLPGLLFCSKAGASFPRQPSMDSNEDRKMDFDDHRDFMDIPAGQFPTADPGPIHQFLSGIPDWMNINQEDLYLALESLPIPLKGPIPHGICLQDAIG
jgi:hypothetical protein